MTCEEFQGLLSSFSFGWPLKTWEPSLKVIRVRDHDFLFSLAGVAPDRETGEPRHIEMLQSLPLGVLSLERDLALNLIRRLLDNWLLHEIHEAILVDGVRLWDPHKSRL